MIQFCTGRAFGTCRNPTYGATPTLTQRHGQRESASKRLSRLPLRLNRKAHKLVFGPVLYDAMQALFTLKFPHSPKYIFVSRLDLAHGIADLLAAHDGAGEAGTSGQQEFQDGPEYLSVSGSGRDEPRADFV